MPSSRVARICSALSIATLAACSGGLSPDEIARLTMSARIETIEQRKSLVEDANAIEELQHAYGYYFDRGLWDEVANLFVDDGTIEIGLDGVYVGKPRVREYLYALGGGRQGLPAGKLNEHLQVMPVITVARDGLSAKARWRAITLTGEHGGEAFWGEGPYENEYVKDGGVWRIKSVHWYQALHVPYEKGWQTAPDPTGGKYVSATLPPDRPPSVDYKTWPDTYVPPFSFPNPVGKYGANEPPVPPVSPPARDTIHLGAVTNTSFEAPSLETLAARAAALELDITGLEDVNAIKRLQRIYGFYTDKQLWTAAADLFAAGGTIEVGGRGVYVGRERVLEFLRSNGPEFPQPKRLFDHMQLQPIVTVAADGLAAKGRWHVFAQEAVHGEYARWGLGVLENEYVKEGGTWKIGREHFFTTMYTPYEAGWGKEAIPNAPPLAELPPDRPPSVAYEAYPAAFVVPFHYENPVTGTRASTTLAPSTGAEVATVEADLADLERRIGLLEDITQLERLNSIYGYYLAHLQWDDLTGIFAPTGTIEIAMRGVYAGSASVRRNLNLYGQATDSQFGLQHNHMQFQPVVDVAPDGQTAKMRSRALSIMGQYERYSQWMGGVYENDLVKENGVWKIAKDQVFNTYFVPYTVGWKDVQPRPPPGITATNPPDLPPTLPFEMYPSPFLPPFHYVHPVTGQPVVGPPP